MKMLCVLAKKETFRVYFDYFILNIVTQKNLLLEKSHVTTLVPFFSLKLL